MHHEYKLTICLGFFVLPFIAFRGLAQNSTKVDKIITLPSKFFSALDKKSSSIEQKLDKQTNRYLTRLQKSEQKLKKQLWKKDSLKAKELFGDIDQRYAALRTTSGQVSTFSQVYSGHLDSLCTALRFLGNQQGKLSPEMQQSLAHYKELQQQLNASDQIRKQLLQRQQLLKQQFAQLGMIKQLKQFRKQVYYYQAQIQEYKDLFENTSKLEAKLMDLAMNIPQFRQFFAKNSILGSLFSLPGNGSEPTASLQGLQTRAMVNQSLIDRFGTGASVTQQLRQNMQSAQGQLNELKNKISQYSSGSLGNGDPDLPPLKLNSQKTKTFLSRLEYSANIQSQKARYFFPVTSDIGLSLGYKFRDNGSFGLGASYKLGWGRGWNNIAITHQGVGVRSYLDWKIKGSLYLSGGYEQNYRSLIATVDLLRNYSAWQSSGLIGLAKKYKVSKKMKGEMKLLWDFLSYQQVPRTQSILFRIGYSFIKK